ncbi:dihydroxyacetone kinase phosphoryl donor subunit DhaM [Agrococcus sp. SL85]|uniref:dihydroxyacetone kinase phosphoryl donor subunit DhaM n=1 Tax=Agrococcus sp. SL85 TaxID=2995141 RepID=UPI00226CB4FE|nr:dihydroxyacetone kinase phosphoryl donor subunit DhaM [Agrococcus sp. SL85]WAC65983.1 dihydroxyacetone kinase phosphoryl donor subunit DhaM [Agrococcus sp. SL85]
MTVGLLVVSHSRLLADGVAELAGQMAHGVTIATAGGTDDGGIGTSFDLVVAGLAEADSGDGVVVLCDLGSAVMTAETALDLAEHPDRVRIADAPIAEGAVAAAVAAELGRDLQAVLAAAEAAGRPEAEVPEAAAGAADGAVRLDVRLENPHGLHARPAAELVRTAAAFDAATTVNGVDATSMLRVLALGLEQGATASFASTGPQAAEAIAAIDALAREGFGEGV